MSTQCAQGMLLFLVLVVNSVRVRLLRSYFSRPFLCALDVSHKACQQSLLNYTNNLQQLTKHDTGRNNGTQMTLKYINNTKKTFAVILVK